jgi:hypothetical protein
MFNVPLRTVRTLVLVQIEPAPVTVALAVLPASAAMDAWRELITPPFSTITKPALIRTAVSPINRPPVETVTAPDALEGPPRSRKEVAAVLIVPSMSVRRPNLPS